MANFLFNICCIEHFYKESNQTFCIPFSSFFEEKTIMLTMASPILSKAWFNNPVTGLPYTSIFKNYGKSKAKMIRLANAVNYLINTGLIVKGAGHDRHLVSARKETFMKTPPSIIRGDANKLLALESIDINIDTYEHHYLNSPLPAHTELTEETIKLILSNDEYISIAHLFNDVRIEQEMEHRVSSHTVQHEFVHGKKQYRMVSSSQQMNAGIVLFFIAILFVIIFIYR